MEQLPYSTLVPGEVAPYLDECTLDKIYKSNKYECFKEGIIKLQYLVNYVLLIL